jgi:hypothetical protein
MTDELAENQGRIRWGAKQNQVEWIGFNHSRTVFNPVRMMRSMSCG